MLVKIIKKNPQSENGDRSYTTCFTEVNMPDLYADYATKTLLSDQWMTKEQFIASLKPIGKLAIRICPISFNGDCSFSNLSRNPRPVLLLGRTKHHIVFYDFADGRFYLQDKYWNDLSEWKFISDWCPTCTQHLLDAFIETI